MSATSQQPRRGALPQPPVKNSSAPSFPGVNRTRSSTCGDGSCEVSYGAIGSTASPAAAPRQPITPPTISQSAATRGGGGSGLRGRPMRKPRPCSLSGTAQLHHTPPVHQNVRSGPTSLGSSGGSAKDHPGRSPKLAPPLPPRASLPHAISPRGMNAILQGQEDTSPPASQILASDKRSPPCIPMPSPSFGGPRKPLSSRPAVSPLPRRITFGGDGGYGDSSSRSSPQLEGEAELSPRNLKLRRRLSAQLEEIEKNQGTLLEDDETTDDGGSTKGKKKITREYSTTFVKISEGSSLTESVELVTNGTIVQESQDFQKNREKLRLDFKTKTKSKHHKHKSVLTRLKFQNKSQSSKDKAREQAPSLQIGAPKLVKGTNPLHIDSSVVVQKPSIEGMASNAFTGKKVPQEGKDAPTKPSAPVPANVTKGDKSQQKKKLPLKFAGAKKDADKNSCVVSRKLGCSVPITENAAAAEDNAQLRDIVRMYNPTMKKHWLNLSLSRLKENDSKLTELCLDTSEFKVNSKYFQKLLDGLRTNTETVSLLLRYQGIAASDSAEAITALSHILAGDSSGLILLDLSFSEISLKALQSLLELARVNLSLREIVLEDIVVIDCAAVDIPVVSSLDGLNMLLTTANSSQRGSDGLGGSNTAGSTMNGSVQGRFQRSSSVGGGAAPGAQPTFPSASNSSNSGSSHRSPPAEQQVDIERVHCLLNQVEIYLEQNSTLAESIDGSGEVLLMRGRGLKDYPEALSAINPVLVFEFSSNAVREFPTSLFPNFSDSLTSLVLSNNKISEIPHDINELSSLTVLNVSQNRISELPGSLRELRLLRNLDISNNRITHLPAFLAQIPNMYCINAEGNPVKNISKDRLIFEGRESLSVLESSMTKMVKSYRMKLMFVGEGNVGKTSLITSLLGGKPKQTQHSQYNKATDGIDISNWHVKVANHVEAGAEANTMGDKKVEFSCWDFAGQTIYYPTHQFFISDRAVYVVVFNMTKVVNDMEARSSVIHWLSLLKASCRNYAVVLVGTHFDMVDIDSKEYNTNCDFVKSLAGDFPHIAKCVFVSCKSGLGVPLCVGVLVTVAISQSFAGEEVPKQFFDIENRLLKFCSSLADDKGKYLAAPIISWNKFSTLCQKMKLESEEEQKRAIIFLSNIGAVCYFPDVDKNVITIDPMYLTNLFASIVSMKNQFTKKGVMSIKDLKQIWLPPDHPHELHPFFMSLLESFELIYRLEEEKILIPALLPKGPLTESENVEITWGEMRNHRPLPIVPVKRKEMANPSAPPPPPPPPRPPRSRGAYLNIEPVVKRKVKQFSRFFLFKTIPHGLFPRLIVRSLNSLDWTPDVFSKDWMKMTKEDDSVLLQQLWDEKKLYIRVRGENPAASFVDLIDGISTLITECYHMKVVSVIECVHCIAQSNHDNPLAPTLFTLRQIEAEVAAGRPMVLCKGETPVPLSELAPDVVLENLSDCDLATWTDVEIEDKPAGIGGYAEVFKGIYKGQEVAVKRFKGDLFNSSTESNNTSVFAAFRREVAFMATLRNKNVVSLKAVLLDEAIGVVMEWCDQGSLFDCLHVNDLPISWMNRVYIAKDIVKGMRFLHSNNFIHRDLKSPNVLLTSYKGRGYCDNRLVAKIADFGVSCKTHFSMTVQRKQVDNPIWTAPEILAGKQYSMKVDVYSFGVICWELLTRSQFFSEIPFYHQVEKAVVAGKRPTIPSYQTNTASKGLATMMQDCWVSEPSARPDFSTLAITLSDIVIKLLADFIEEHSEEAV